MPARELEETDPEIAAECAHLDVSRAALRRMRENVLALDASAAGDRVPAQVFDRDTGLRPLSDMGNTPRRGGCAGVRIAHVCAL